LAKNQLIYPKAIGINQITFTVFDQHDNQNRSYQGRSHTAGKMELNRAAVAHPS
jgi:hypothetical protein